MKRKLSDEERFWAKVTKHPNGCWLWTASKFHFGHGVFYWQGKNQKAHRYSYWLHFGNLPKQVNHRPDECNNSSCVNPAHLYDGDQADNNRDRVIAGTQPMDIAIRRKNNPHWQQRGETHYQGKLTNKQVLEIRSKYVPRKYTLLKLANEYNVSFQMISMIINRNTWKHI